MTDNEIIKALENCGNVGECSKCPLNELGQGISLCIPHLTRSALYLINRQKAELERLKSMNQSKLDIIHDVRADLETAKVEAIKEFAERLKEKMKNCAMYCSDKHTYYLIGYPLIDNLVKEMTEERK